MDQGICTVGGGVKPHREANPSGGVVGCEPFQSNSLEVTRQNGIAILSQRNSLTGLKVLFGNDKFAPGDKVFFEGDQCATLWAKKVYELDGTKFVLAPNELVKLVERSSIYG